MIDADPIVPNLRNRIDRVIKAYVAGRESLFEEEEFPREIWAALADEGLFGVALPSDMGGLGGGFHALAESARYMSASGGVMGVTLTWLCHNTNETLHMLGRGTPAQRSRWLPDLARGYGSVSVAISEPGAGAHPKFMKTIARRDGDDFVIDGEKSYLTNGPLATVFIVLAITGEANGRKSFSAILVPRDAPGLTITPGIEIDFLKPSPHCGLELVGCKVPAENLLGDLGAGFEQVSVPMRVVEDTLGASVLTGALQAELRALADNVDFSNNGEALASFGNLLEKTDTLVSLADEMAAQLDVGLDDLAGLSKESAGFRGFVRHLQADIDAFIEGQELNPSSFFAHLRRDVVKSLGIASTAHRIQAVKRAQTYIDNKESI